MGAPFEDLLQFLEGYRSDQPPLGLQRDALAPGSKNVYPDGLGLIRSWNGLLNTAIRGATNAMLIFNDSGGIDGPGTVIGYRGNAVCFVGTGNVIRAGSVIGVALSAVQMFISPTTYTLGLDPPSAPVIHLSDGLDGYGTATGNIFDSTSVQLTFRRTATAGESNASGASNVVIPGTTGRKIYINFPAQSQGADIVRVWVPFQGFGTLGPRFLHPTEFRYNGGPYTESNTNLDPAAAGTNNRKLLDYQDGDLLTVFTAPYAYFKPPAATHVFGLGPYLVPAGCDPVGGFGLAPSLPNRPDAYDPDHRVFLNPGAPITACIGRATDGFQYIAQRDALHGAIMSGDPTLPILPRVLWGNDGFPNANCMAYTESEMIGMSSYRGAVRTQSGEQPDRSFAARVARDFANWTPDNVVVGFDPAYNHAVFAHGTEAYLYDRRLDQWGAQCELPGTVVSKCTVGGRLNLVVNSGGNNELWQWNNGTFSGEWVAVSTMRDQGRNRQHTLTGAAFQGSQNLTVRYLKDLTATVVRGPDAVTLSSGESAWQKLNLPRLRCYGVDVRGTGRGASLYSVVLTGLVTDARA